MYVGAKGIRKYCIVGLLDEGKVVLSCAILYQHVIATAHYQGYVLMTTFALQLETVLFSSDVLYNGKGKLKLKILRFG